MSFNGKHEQEAYTNTPEEIEHVSKIIDAIASDPELMRELLGIPVPS